MRIYSSVRLKIKGEGQVITVSSPHPLTRRDLEAMIDALVIKRTAMNS